METVFHISNIPKKYQVKYTSCYLQDSALSWWNSHKRKIETDAAYAMTWNALMKLTTEDKCKLHHHGPCPVRCGNCKKVSREVRQRREAAEKAFEASKDKDETIKSLEELRFLALSTKDLSDDDAYWIERKKAQIKAKLRAEIPMEPNNEDDSDE
uniref:Retrotransposon gag domain-containing protein n=1 Tax=Tanacetum cinerariifolium TaxID=118510 RepID=A0A6L2M6G2_TANCI|nr:hypothetical protein [Tanacetum cinerariifolium]